MPAARGERIAFFEWIYFANVASTLDERSVYLTRKRLGEELARLETVPLDDDTIVVPVPDTSKAAADAMAYKLRVPAVEGLIRNRYTGRTFIEGTGNRRQKAETKYTPAARSAGGQAGALGRRFDRSLHDDEGADSPHARIGRRAREIHVRIACPPIIAPCFYGIDMSTIGELFAPPFLRDGQLTDEAQAEMARQSGGRFAALSAGRIDRAGDRLRRRSTLPGLHHRRISDAVWAEALSDRTRPSRTSGSGRSVRMNLH